MDTKLYNTRITINLDAVGEPDVIAYLDGVPFTFIRKISGPTSFMVNRDLTDGSHVLEIKHLHKQNDDPSTALIIKSITFNDITRDNFIWTGKYTPDYPEPWATEQGDTLARELTHTGYLGWNGTWRLDFTAPIFTWIHGVENLGWIYD